MRLLIFTVSFILFAHVTACLWWLVAVLEEDVPETWPIRYGIWLSTVDVQYVASVYYTFTLLTTTGLGDIVPVTIAEQLYTVFLELMGVTIFSYITSSVSSLIGTFDAHAQRRREKQDELERFMAAKGLSAKLRGQIRDYYELIWDRKAAAFDESALINELSAPLQTGVLYEVYKPVIDKFSFFRRKDRDFVREFFKCVYPLIVRDSAVIVKEGAAGTALYLLAVGRVNFESGAGRVYMQLPPGSVFGEIALLCTGKQVVTARAVGFCEVYVIQRRELEAILVDYPEVEAELLSLALTRLKRIREQRQREAESGSLGSGASFVAAKSRDSVDMEAIATRVKQLQKKASEKAMVHHADAANLERPAEADDAGSSGVGPDRQRAFSTDSAPRPARRMTPNLSTVDEDSKVTGVRPTAVHFGPSRPAARSQPSDDESEGGEDGEVQVVVRGGGGGPSALQRPPASHNAGRVPLSQAPSTESPSASASAVPPAPTLGQAGKTSSLSSRAISFLAQASSRFLPRGTRRNSADAVQPLNNDSGGLSPDETEAAVRRALQSQTDALIDQTLRTVETAASAHQRITTRISAGANRTLRAVPAAESQGHDPSIVTDLATAARAAEANSPTTMFRTQLIADAVASSASHAPRMARHPSAPSRTIGLRVQDLRDSVAKRRRRLSQSRDQRASAALDSPALRSPTAVQDLTAGAAMGATPLADMTRVIRAVQVALAGLQAEQQSIVDLLLDLYSTDQDGSPAGSSMEAATGTQGLDNSEQGSTSEAGSPTWANPRADTAPRLTLPTIPPVTEHSLETSTGGEAATTHA